MTTSLNNTVISLPGQTIVDANGNAWSIINGRVAVNGVVDMTTANVIEMAYENGRIWQKNTNNLWWSKGRPADSWGPPAGTAVDPIPNQHPSSNDTIVTVIPGVATTSITDASGNLWSIANGRVTLNGVADPTTANVIELAYVGGKIWQENASLLWWSKTRPSDPWGPPAGTSVNPALSVTRTWNGAAAAFATPGDWSPNGVPQTGDTAVIGSGDVTVALNTGFQVNFTLQGGEVDFRTPGSYSIAVLRGTGVVGIGYPTQTVILNTSGIVMNGGLLTAQEFISSGSVLIVHGNSSLTNGATLNVQYVGTGGLPRAQFGNDGTMTVSGSTLAVGALSGTGVISATANSTIDVTAASSGETIQLQSAHLYVGGLPIPTSTGMQFVASVTNFGATSAITFNNTQATREVFSKVTPTAGELFLYNGQTLVADFHVSGQANLYASVAGVGTASAVTITAYDTGHSLPSASH